MHFNAEGFVRYVLVVCNLNGIVYFTRGNGSFEGENGRVSTYPDECEKTQCLRMSAQFNDRENEHLKK